jgi:hypothetical protein
MVLLLVFPMLLPTRKKIKVIGQKNSKNNNSTSRDEFPLKK